MNSGDAFISLTGFIATQPTKRTTRTGISAVTMRVAWTPRWLDRDSGEWTDGRSSFATVQCYRKLADNAALCLRVGDAIQVRGKVSIREYEGKNGEKGINVDIDATSIGHDLNRGIANFSRARQGTGPTAAELEASGEEIHVPAAVPGRDGSGDSLTPASMESADSTESADGLEAVGAPF